MRVHVRARVAAIVAGLLAGLYLVALFHVRRVPDGILAALGGPSGLARDGGLAVRYRPPPGIDTARLERELAGRGATLHHEAGWLVIELRGIADDEAGDVAAMLANGGLEFREVFDDMSLLKVAEHGDDRIDRVAGVRVEIDVWTPESSPGRHTSSYLIANTLGEIDAAFDEASRAGWRPPPHSTIVYGQVDPPSWLHVHHRMWRSYLVGDRAELDGSAVMNAVASHDPNTARPVVLVEFSREAGRRFADLTRRITGRKLAILVGGVVKSAPVINGPIPGGRAAIAMGGAALDDQEREAAVTVEVLKVGALPPGGTLEGQTWVPPTPPGHALLLARLVIGLAGGALVGLGFGLVVRVARPSWYRPPGRRGRLPIRRLAVTLLAPVALVALAQLELPGVDVPELYHALVRDRGRSPIEFTVIALGVSPIISAFIVVELATLLVPRWRRARLSPAARIAIGRWVAITGVAFTLLQAHIVHGFLARITESGGGEPGWQPYLTVVASLTAGTLLLVIVAGMIRQHGLGNGYGALIVSGWLLAVGWRLLGAPDAGDALGVATLAVIACATVALLRMRIGDDGAAPLRLPTSGAIPLATARTVAGLWSLVSFGLAALPRAAVQWQHGWPFLVAVALLVPVWSLAFSRPAIVALPAARSALAPPRWTEWRRGVLVSLAGLLAIAGAYQLTAATSSGAEPWCEPLSAMMFAAVALDALDDLRARRGDLVVAWPLHHAQHAELVRQALAGAGIECRLAASHLRSLLAWFGPYAPIDVLVPAASVDEARRKIGGLFADAAVEAFD